MRRRRPIPRTGWRRDVLIAELTAQGAPLSEVEKQRLAATPWIADLAAKLRKRMLDGAIVGDGGIIFGSID